MTAEQIALMMSVSSELAKLTAEYYHNLIKEGIPPNVALGIASVHQNNMFERLCPAPPPKPEWERDA